jgi:oligopeptide/dipeptide ABC transporter ATP-binding protein
VSATRAGPRQALSGEPPDPAAPPSGCPFHPRCPLVREECRTVRPELRRKVGGQVAACHVAADAAEVAA